MSGWSAVKLIAAREIRERVSGRLTRIMTLLTAALVVAGVVLPGVINGSSSATQIGLVGRPAQALAPLIRRSAAAAKQRVTLSDPGSAEAARKLLRSGGLDVSLAIEGAVARITVKESLAISVRAVLEEDLDEAHLREGLARAGLPLARVLPALRPVPVRTEVLQPAPPGRAVRAVAAIVAALLMYLVLSLYGGAVAGGVAQEKTSRTAEVLLAAVRPAQLLTGKVLGIGAVGLGQLSIAAAAGLVANAVVHSARIPASVIVLLPAFLVCFLAGFTLYAFAMAAAGALVARQEELQLVMLPVGLPLLIGYLLVYPAVGSPDATWLKVASFLPPLTATLMPARIALGHIAVWELPLAAALMAASIYGMVRVASRVYSGALIHGGARLSWRQAAALSRAESAPPAR